MSRDEIIIDILNPLSNYGIFLNDNGNELRDIPPIVVYWIITDTELFSALHCTVSLVDRYARSHIV